MAFCHHDRPPRQRAMQRGAQAKGTGPDHHHISVHDASVPPGLRRALEGGTTRATEASAVQVSGAVSRRGVTPYGGSSLQSRKALSQAGPGLAPAGRDPAM